MLLKSTLLDLFTGRSNGSMRLNHSDIDPGCNGSSKSLLVTKDSATIGAYCFRCGEKARYPINGAFNRYTQRQETVVEDRSWRTSFPAGEVDFLKWPRHVSTWCLKFVHTGTLRVSNFRWDWERQRLWMPVFKEGKVVKWNGRVFGDGPKYLTGQVKNYTCHDPFHQRCYTNDHVYLVEDILSALRLAQETRSAAYPCLGTGVTLTGLHRLTQELAYRRATVWLDNDNYQVGVARRKLQRQLEGFGVKVDVVLHRVDPKEASLEIIHERSE